MSTAYESSLDGEDFDEAPAGDTPQDRMAYARSMGWKPFEEYRGDPARWTDYEEFIRRGEEELPIVREQNKRMGSRIQRMEGELGTLRNTVAEQAQAVRDATELARRADERGYQRALAELKAEQRAAVQQGDTEAFDQIGEQLEALETTRREAPPASPPPPPASPPAPAPPESSQATKDFVNKHRSWFYDKDRPHLQQAMIAMHNALIQEGVATNDVLPLSEQLEVAFERLQAKYPSVNFGDHDDMADPDPPPRRERPQAPAMRPRGGGYAPRSPPGGGDPFMRIDANERADARKAFENMKRHDETVTADEYVQLYENPRLDVLSLRRQRTK